MLICLKNEVRRSSALVRIRLTIVVNFEPFGNTLIEVIVCFCAVPQQQEILLSLRLNQITQKDGISFPFQCGCQYTAKHIGILNLHLDDVKNKARVLAQTKKKKHEQTRPAEYFSVLAFLCKGPGLAQSSYLSLTSSVHLQKLQRQHIGVYIGNIFQQPSRRVSL